VRFAGVLREVFTKKEIPIARGLRRIFINLN